MMPRAKPLQFRVSRKLEGYLDCLVSPTADNAAGIWAVQPFRSDCSEMCLLLRTTVLTHASGMMDGVTTETSTHCKLKVDDGSENPLQGTAK